MVAPGEQTVCEEEGGQVGWVEVAFFLELEQLS